MLGNVYFFSSDCRSLLLAGLWGILPSIYIILAIFTSLTPVSLDRKLLLISLHAAICYSLGREKNATFDKEAVLELGWSVRQTLCRSIILYLSGHRSLCFNNLAISHHPVVGCDDIFVHILLCLLVYVSFQWECELLVGRTSSFYPSVCSRIPDWN